MLEKYFKNSSEVFAKPFIKILKYLNLALEQYGVDKKKVFNVRGKSFKSINLDINLLSSET